MKTSITILITILTLFNIHGDDPVKQIDAYKKEVSTLIKKCDGSTTCPIFSNEVIVNSNQSSWRRISDYERKITFWYDEDPTTCTNCGENGVNSLLKVTIDERTKASRLIQELLYKEGGLVHYKKNETGKSTGERSSSFYFNQKTLVQYTENGEVMNSRIEDMNWPKLISMANEYRTLYVKSFQ